MSQEIQLLTWNILFDTDRYGADFTWDKRREKFCSFIKSHIDPHQNQVFCFQEVTERQRADILSLFPLEFYEYFSVQCGRVFSIVTILSKAMKIRHIDMGSLNRFLVLENDHLRMINTHFPVEFDKRLVCSVQLGALADATQKNFVCCGDMNTFHDVGGPEMIERLERDGLRDVFVQMEDGQPAVHTIEMYPKDSHFGRPVLYPLDHILVRGVECDHATVHEVRTHEVSGVMYGASDHFALTANLTLP